MIRVTVEVSSGDYNERSELETVWEKETVIEGSPTVIAGALRALAEDLDPRWVSKRKM